MWHGQDPRIALDRIVIPREASSNPEGVARRFPAPFGGL